MSPDINKYPWGKSRGESPQVENHCHFHLLCQMKERAQGLVLEDLGVSGHFLLLMSWPWPNHLAFLFTCFGISEAGCCEGQMRCGRFSNIERGHYEGTFYCYYCKIAPEVKVCREATGPICPLGSRSLLGL